MFEKQKQLKIKGKKSSGFKRTKKAVEGKSEDKLSMQKKIYNRLLKERTSEKQKISDEINDGDLIYYFIIYYKVQVLLYILLNMKIHQIFMIK